MNRNGIIAICLVFCGIAVVAGWIVAGMSTSSAVIAVQATSEAPATVAPQAASVVAAGAGAAQPAATSVPTPAAAPQAPTATLQAPTTAPQAPSTAPTSAPATEISVPAPTIVATAPVEPTFVEYTVQKGDLLNAIAKQYDVTAKDILDVNQIANPDSLIVGQVLRIPKK
jgi:LysM repeat protein